MNTQRYIIATTIAGFFLLPVLCGAQPRYPQSMGILNRGQEQSQGGEQESSKRRGRGQSITQQTQTPSSVGSQPQGSNLTQQSLRDFRSGGRRSSQNQSGSSGQSESGQASQGSSWRSGSDQLGQGASHGRLGQSVGSQSGGEQGTEGSQSDLTQQRKRQLQERLEQLRNRSGQGQSEGLTEQAGQEPTGVSNRGIEKKDIRRGMTLEQLRSRRQTEGQGQQTGQDQATQAGQQVSGEQQTGGQQTGTRGQGTGMRTREDLRKLIEERRKQGQGQTGEAGQAGQQGQQTGAEQSQGVGEPTGGQQVGTGTSAGGKRTREDLRKLIEERRKQQQGQTGETGQAGQQAGQQQGQQTEVGQGQSAGQQAGEQQAGTGAGLGGKRTREDLRKLIEERRKQGQGQTDQAGQTGQAGQQGQQQGVGEQTGGQQVGTGIGAGGKRTREDLRKLIEERRKQQQGQTGEAGQTGQEGQQQSQQQLSGNQRFGRNQLDDAERQRIRNMLQQGQHQDVSELVQRLRQEHGDRLNTEEGRSAFRQQLQELRRARGEQQAQLLGANLEQKRAEFLEQRRSQLLTGQDAITRFGNIEAKPRFQLQQQDLEKLHRGELPSVVPLPRGDWGRLRRPLERELRYVHESWYCPPPPRYRDRGVDYFHFSWHYWDGRYRYDHSWAINIFISIGHTRYGGYDGVIIGGRYFCYGWGWIDGCIDYGDCRVWVPGFWAPYTVTECCDCEVWVPPVYDWVWTGCCWEQVLVAGGYFTRKPANCYTVTRYRWVPGHYQYYRC
ncbi:MAG: hypothetical protein KatS3mg130_0819 [Candidatus Sumerlaea sp.]|nr:MAG: hypothetical protein KatS3mg130_0819 [Candidatus Sumerlaea sp.]